tara:strand:- start:2134 stop:3327 length:1194 start_codon:yes stop_codon:yes gene_type:complete
MKIFTFIIFTFTIKISLGFAPINKDSLQNKLVSIYSNNYTSINSTHLPLSFFKKIFKGGVINEKDLGSTQNLNKTNTSGFELDLSVGFKILNSETNNGWYLKFQNLNTGGVKYAQNLFNCVFIGNKNISSPVKLGNTSFHLRNHQLFHVGLIKKNLSVGLSIGNINSEYQGSFSENSFFNPSSPYLWEISIQPRFLFLENRPKSLLKNGNSFGIDLEFSNCNKNAVSEKLNYSIGINNLGVMLFHDSYKRYEFDTTFTFQGFSFEEILNFDSTILSLYETIEPSLEEKNELQISPFHIFSEFSYHFKDFKLITALNYRHKSQYIPKIHLGLEKKLNNNFAIGNSISYGGFNKFQWGTNINYSINKLKINLIFNNIVGFAPSLGKSFGINLGFTLDIN